MVAVVLVVAASSKGEEEVWEWEGTSAVARITVTLHPHLFAGGEPEVKGRLMCFPRWDGGPVLRGEGEGMRIERENEKETKATNLN